MKLTKLNIVFSIVSYYMALAFIGIIFNCLVEIMAWSIFIWLIIYFVIGFHWYFSDQMKYMNEMMTSDKKHD